MKVYIHQEPERKRKDSFWFDGHVATVENNNTTVKVIAMGEINVCFNPNERIFKNDEARQEAICRGYTDIKLFHLSKHDGWQNNNWFAFEVLKDDKDPYWDTETSVNFNDAILIAKLLSKTS